MRQAYWPGGLRNTLGAYKATVFTGALLTGGWACRYERRYIQRWLNSGNATCPASGQVLTLPATLTPNLALRKSIEAWAEKYAQWLLVSSRACLFSHLYKCNGKLSAQIACCSGGTGIQCTLCFSICISTIVPPEKQPAASQDADGHVRPIPDDEDFADAPAADADADMALAIHLQEEEMSHVSTPPPMLPFAPLLRRCRLSASQDAPAHMVALKSCHRLPRAVGAEEAVWG